MKRDISAADVSFSSLSSAGTKRSVRDRIGSSSDSSLWHGNGPSNNKRFVCCLFSVYNYYGVQHNDIYIYL